MTAVTISGAGAHAAISATDRIPASRSGAKGYFTVDQLVKFALSYNAGIKTANAPILNLSETWNNGAVAFDGIVYNPTDTASLAASYLMRLKTGGVDRFSVQKSGFVYSTSSGQFDGGLFIQSDVVLRRDAANALAQRNGVNAQAFRLYNTYTDASNYERAGLVWAANFFKIIAEAAGTGVKRDVVISGNNVYLNYGSDATAWRVNTSGHFWAGADNTFDIGASGANRPRNGYLGNLLNINGKVSLYSGSADGVAVMTNNALTDFGRLCLGGTTSSFPALKRSGAEIQARLADDSAGATFRASTFRLGNSSQISDSSDGVILLRNNAGDGFTRLQFGGTTSAFPSLKRSNALFQARLADDSAYAYFHARLGTHASAVAETITPTHTIVIHDVNGTAYRVPCAV